MLSEQSEELYYKSADIPLSITPKKRILKIAEYMFPHLKSKLLEDCVIGFQLNKDEFIQCQKLSQYNIFVQTADMNTNKDTDILKKESGLYLSLYCNCHYGLIDDDIKLNIKTSLTSINLVFAAMFLYFLLEIIGLLQQIQKKYHKYVYR